jgi:hypothetical protein
MNGSRPNPSARSQPAWREWPITGVWPERLFSPDCHWVSTHTQNIGVFLHHSKQLQEQLALLRHFPMVLKAAHEPRGALYTDQLLYLKPGFFHLPFQLIGMMKESRREICGVIGWIAVLTALQILHENTDKDGIGHQIA